MNRRRDVILSEGETLQTSFRSHLPGLGHTMLRLTPFLHIKHHHGVMLLGYPGENVYIHACAWFRLNNR